jgi:multidrug transporter EmrE-like cation transporter
MNTIYLLIAITIASILYTIIAKEYITTKRKRCLLYIIIIEIIAYTCLIKILSRHDLSSVASILTCVSIILMTIIGIVLYKECINGRIILGIICAIIALYLLSIDVK